MFGNSVLHLSLLGIEVTASGTVNIFFKGKHSGTIKESTLELSRQHPPPFPALVYTSHK
jgi:hypothetical protein